MGILGYSHFDVVIWVKILNEFDPGPALGLSWVERGPFMVVEKTKSEIWMKSLGDLTE